MDKIKKDEGRMDFPSEFKMLLNKKFVFKIQVSSFNLEKNYLSYTVHRLTDDERVIEEVLKHSPGYEEGNMIDDSTPTNNAKKGKEMVEVCDDNANVIDLESITPLTNHGKRAIELVENTPVGHSSSKSHVAGSLKIPKMEKLE